MNRRERLLENVVRALILFHRGGHWSDEDTSVWHNLLIPILGEGPHEVTTKKLCDAARAACRKAQP